MKGEALICLNLLGLLAPNGLLRRVVCRALFIHGQGFNFLQQVVLNRGGESFR
jgi:hypothetical protein